VEVRRYDEGSGVATKIDVASISECVGGDGTLVWVDMAEPSAEAVELLVEEFAVERLEAEDLLHPRQRPKLERYGDHFLLVVYDCALDGTRFVAREIDVVLGDGWLVTVRKPSDDGDAPVDLDEAVHRFERQRREVGATDEGFLLYVLLDTIVDGYFDLTDRIDTRLEELEDVVFGVGAETDTQRDIYKLRETLVGFRRVAAPLREVVSALQRREVEFFGDAAIAHLRDVYDHVLRVSELNEAQRDLMTGALEAHLAVVSNRMNEVMKATSSWGAILVVATLIAGIYGMNFGHMPELRWYFGYPFALGLMAVSTLALYRAFKARGWL
jgi:magnesium transporter